MNYSDCECVRFLLQLFANCVEVLLCMVQNRCVFCVDVTSEYVNEQMLYNCKSKHFSGANGVKSFMRCSYQRISIPAYAIETTMMTGVPKNEMSIISLIYKNYARSLARRVTMWLSFKNLLTRQQMVVHLFLALTVSIRWRLLSPTLC
jgi:hypothetical protein